jgi:hypothetical protein
MADEQPSTSDPVDAQVFSAEGGLRPDHPLLRRAQEALKSQFTAEQTRLKEELREKANALKVRATPVSALSPAVFVA